MAVIDRFPPCGTAGSPSTAVFSADWPPAPSSSASAGNTSGNGLTSVAPGLILAQAIGWWGNFFNQEAYGAPAPSWVMRMPPAFIRNQMWIDGAYMHPTFLYESLWNLASFGLLLVWRRRILYEDQATGQHMAG